MRARTQRVVVTGARALLIMAALAALLTPAGALGATDAKEPNPKQLVLQQKDLPKLQVITTGKLSLTANGFVDGFGTAFNPKKGARSGVTGISQALVFASDAAAKTALQQMYKTLNPNRRIKTDARIGREGRLYAVPLKRTPGGKAKRVPYYYWRHKNAVALVSSSGSSSSALALAKKQQARMAKAFK